MKSLLNAEPFKTRLPHAIIWCSERVAIGKRKHKVSHWQSGWHPEIEGIVLEDMESLLRSPELKPPDVFRYESHLQGWDDHAVRQAVDALCARRAQLLRERGKHSTALPQGLAGGRLLVSMPGSTLSDGASYTATGGYFGCDDVPPCDTWLHYQDSRLISWVHPELIAIVDDGIYVNAAGCLFWLDE